MRQLTVKEQKELISDDEVHTAFLKREDVARLSPDEQETRWQKHLIELEKFRQSLANIPVFCGE